MAVQTLKNLWKISLSKLALPVVFVLFFLTGTLAHSFNVALIIPLSGPNAQQGKQFLNGFMLATTERDAHPNQESDGHLGGLDVYVTTIDENEDIVSQINMLNMDPQVDIVSYFTTPDKSSVIQNNLDQSVIALLVPGEISEENVDRIGNDNFFTTFGKTYNEEPTTAAIRGYNAARRIDLAVRAQGAASDIADLAKSFNESASGFKW